MKICNVEDNSLNSTPEQGILDSMALLQQQSLFKGLSLDELKLIDKKVFVKTFPAQTHLFTTEHTGTEVYVLLTGRVKIYMKERHGYYVTLCFRGKNELLGEISAIDSLMPSANVLTVDTCSTLVFKRHHFLNFMQTLPSFSFNVSKVLTDRIRFATDRITTLSTLKTSSRIARQLFALSNKDDCSLYNNEGHKAGWGDSLPTRELKLPVGLTQQELAEMVGCSREQVNRILKQFINEGIVSKSSDKTWIILDYEKLNYYAN